MSKDYEPTFSDHALENRYGGQFMTASAAYRKDAVMTVGGFDERLDYLDDRETALKIMRHGKIRFNPNMIAYYPRVIMTPAKFIKSAAATKNRVTLFKRFGERKFMLWRIVEPFKRAWVFLNGPKMVLNPFVV